MNKTTKEGNAVTPNTDTQWKRQLFLFLFLNLTSITLYLFPNNFERILYQVLV